MCTTICKQSTQHCLEDNIPCFVTNDTIMLGLTFVVQVAFSGSTNLSSLWTTAAGHNLETLVSIMKVSI